MKNQLNNFKKLLLREELIVLQFTLNQVLNLNVFLKDNIQCQLVWVN